MNVQEILPDTNVEADLDAKTFWFDDLVFSFDDVFGNTSSQTGFGENYDLSFVNAVTEIPILGNINELIDRYVSDFKDEKNPPSHAEENLQANASRYKILVTVRPNPNATSAAAGSSEHGKSQEIRTTRLVLDHYDETKVDLTPPKMVNPHWAKYADSDASDPESDLEPVEDARPTTTLHYLTKKGAWAVNKKGGNVYPAVLKFQDNMVALNPKRRAEDVDESGGEIHYTVKQANTIYFDNGFRFEVFQHDGFKDYILKTIYRYPKTNKEHSLCSILFMYRSSKLIAPSSQVNLFMKPHSQVAIHVDEV